MNSINRLFESMKKQIVFFLLFIIVIKFCAAQKVSITGIVKEPNSKAIPSASIKITNSKTGVTSNDSGYFSLSVSPNTSLHISSVGYKDTVINIGNQTTLNIILQPKENYLNNVTVTQNLHRYEINNQIKNQVYEAAVFHYKYENDISGPIRVYKSGYFKFNSPTTVWNGTAIPEFHTREDTKGSIYLFSNWQRGLVAKSDDRTIVDDSSSLYNLNKVTGALIMTKDFNSGLTIDKAEIKFFTLFDSLKNSHSFMIVPAISSSSFCEIIALGNDYDIFKLTTTKFVKANLSTDGFATSGSNYDEYVDTRQYYLLNVKDGSVTKFEPKKKEIKQVFANNTSAQQFLNLHKADEINDAFLKNIIANIN